MLVLRVKRHRDDDPAENICVFDNKAKIGLENGEHGHSIVLKRMKTLDYDLGATESINSIKNFAASTSISTDDSVSNAPTQKVMIPISKKRVFSDRDESMVVVDLAQVESGTSSSTSTASTSIKVLNPASRLLQKGIIIAMENGNFDEISAALIQGADPDVQTSVSGKFGGCTALMAAVAHANIRMVKRLLLKEVNPVVTNVSGLKASDLQKETKRNRDVNIEIRLLLQSAMSKYYTTLRKAESKKSSTDDNYVMDFYCIPSSSSSASQPPAATAAVQPTVFKTTQSAAVSANPNSEGSSSLGVSVVQIEGLTISAEGEVEIYDNEHDSDWSDLGDDEEPDSNDERYEGNDYPDEEEDDINAYDDDEDIDAMLTGQMNRMGIRDAEQYDTEVDVQHDDDDGYGSDEADGYGERYDDERR